MEKKMMYITAAVAVIVVIVIVAVAYILMNPSGGEGGTETIYTISNATSLQYSVSVSNAPDTTTKYSGKNLNGTDVMMRVDIESGGDSYSYILDASSLTGWSNETGTWVQGNFTAMWNDWNTNCWKPYIAHSPNWVAGDSNITYTDDAGNTITIFNIEINPTLEDSMFQVPH
jgi:hypothetical protein